MEYSRGVKVPFNRFTYYTHFNPLGVLLLFSFSVCLSSYRSHAFPLSQTFGLRDVAVRLSSFHFPFIYQIDFFEFAASCIFYLLPFEISLFVVHIYLYTLPPSPVFPFRDKVLLPES